MMLVQWTEEFSITQTKRGKMAQGHIEDILVLTEEEENTPLFVRPGSRRTIQVRYISFTKKRSNQSLKWRQNQLLTLSFVRLKRKSSLPLHNLKYKLFDIIIQTDGFNNISGGGSGGRIHHINMIRPVQVFFFFTVYLALFSPLPNL